MPLRYLLFPPGLLPVQHTAADRRGRELAGRTVSSTKRSWPMSGLWQLQRRLRISHERLAWAAARLRRVWHAQLRWEASQADCREDGLTAPLQSGQCLVWSFTSGQGWCLLPGPSGSSWMWWWPTEAPSDLRETEFSVCDLRKLCKSRF